MFNIRDSLRLPNVAPAYPIVIAPAFNPGFLD